MTQSTICLIVFALTIILFLSNKIPLWIASLSSMFLLVVTGCITSAEALSGFSNSTTIIMVSMFIISAGLSRTQMIHKITDLVYKVTGGSFAKGLLGYLLVTLIIAQVIPSAVLIYTVCYPLVADFCRKMKISPSKAMFAVGLVSITGVGLTPIGAGAVNYVQYNSLLTLYGADPAYQFGMFDIMIARLPLSIAMVIYGAFISPKFAPDKGLDVGIAVGNSSQQVEKAPLDPVREVLGYGIFLAVVICLLLNDYLPIEMWQTCLAGALLTTISGVLTEKETVTAMNLPPALLFVGALSLGQALVNTGAGDIVGSIVIKLLGGNPNGYVVGLVFFMISFIFTQVMSNLALFSALQPIVILVCTSLGYNPVGPFILCFIGCFTSFLTPMATIMVPVMMNAGGYDQKDVFRQGWLPGIISCVISVPWVMTMFPV